MASKFGKATFHEEATPGGYRVFRRMVKEASTGELDAVGRAFRDRERAREYEREGQHVKPNKTAISEFTQTARNEMRWELTKYDWWGLEDPDHRLAMVTLTMPQDWRAVCPDGRTWVRQIEAFKEAWRRRYGKPQGVWVKEFQPRPSERAEFRQAPHLHMVMRVPRSVRRELEPDESDHSGRMVWPWALETWGRIVGADDAGKHRRRGMDLRWIEYGRGVGMHIDAIAEYFWRETGKAGQKDVPEGFPNVGRFYGVWGMAPISHLRDIGGTEDNDQYFDLRRRAVILRDKRNGRKVKRPRGHDGVRVYGVNGMGVAGGLARWWRDVAPES